MKSRLILVSLLTGLLAACASVPAPDVRREADLNRANAGVAGGAQTSPLNSVEEPETGPQAVIRRGNGQTINRSAASAPMPSLSGASSGSATFNFEGESVHAVVKAILGDMLGQNYVIAPGVQGTVTLGTPKPVSPAEALNLLEMVLGWNNARLVYSGGRYNIIPMDQALAGTVAPSTGPAANARGFEVRVVPLRFISASEMKKVLEPYARPNAIVNTDNARNVITLAGTRTELENYLRTVEIFDVNWLAGMSVGVFPLQSGRATKVVADLEKVFGEASKTPSAGMFRFMPLEGANAVLVITPQAAYLDDIQDWLERIDGAGEGSRLFSYELKYIKAKDLADRLAEVFGSGGNGNQGTGGDGNVSLMPGTDPVQIKDGGMEGGNGTVDFGNSGSSSSGTGGTGGSGSLALGQRGNGNGSVTLQVEGDRVGVAAVEETNSILVRANAGAWKSIRDVIEKLDVMPMQVHIEAQVAQVQLSGELNYGVQWFFEKGATDNGLPDVTGPSIPGKWSTLGASIGGVSGPGLAWTLIKNDAAAIINALDEVTNVRLLSTPSVFVRNNGEATFNVGDRIPISSVSVNPIAGDGTTFSQVQYLETGTTLKVRPRITRDGTVFLDIVQEISQPVGSPDANGNPTISTRKLKTEAATQDGDTIMLAGLISDSAEKGSSGIPGLSRLPIIGSLFGTQRTNSGRSETIILITATIVRNPQEARELTDEYGQKFRALDPLNTPKKK
ncbi:type II secretion system protein GspD [Pseudoxanthomonas yeongjuensis]|uniref:type II secretion system secretin GspD n=1 Tax=Pseudoxanthomonas yeongjuensis TaxID=377616 RepID=UPI001390F6E3|nr:type II secretion system secretin GspD [Pseudoxanthomonas yeongjuensis]KAF1714234.1 type II secretion system protein GspD [Pseudoxanthomonas yeongjuensis]